MGSCPYPAQAGATSDHHCRHDAQLRSEYGPQMTCEVYWTQFYEQDGACGGCLRPWRGTPGAPRAENDENRLSVDHSHEDGPGGQDGRFRGLLCGPCNRLLTEGVVRKILAHPDQDVIALSGGEVVPRGLVAYARRPPAEGLGIWVIKKQRPAIERKITGRTQPVITGGKVSPRRAHFRALLNPGYWPPCPDNCPYAHPGVAWWVPAGAVPLPPRVAPKPEPEPEPVRVILGDVDLYAAFARYALTRRAMRRGECIGGSFTWPPPKLSYGSPPPRGRVAMPDYSSIGS